MFNAKTSEELRAYVSDVLEKMNNMEKKAITILITAANEKGFIEFIRFFKDNHSDDDVKAACEAAFNDLTG